MNFNQVTLAGHLVKDPELTYTQNQTAVANFDIAINYKRGQTEDTCFVHCSAFGNTGENIVKYFTKGRPIFVVGRLHQNRWQAQDGSNRSRMEVIVNEFRFVGSTGGSSGNAQNPEPYDQQVRNSMQNKNEEDVFK